MKGCYFITDRLLSRHGNSFDVAVAESCGVEFIQYREKNLSTRLFYEEALSLKKLCGRSRFIINDRLDIALAVDAHGLHIGQDDLPLPVARSLLGKKKIIGVTVTSLDEAVRAEAEGADYLAPSPIFQTQTKTDAGAAKGIGFIAELKKQTRLPLVAIGGITPDNAAEVVAAGADMICAISAVVRSENPADMINKLQELFT